MSPCLDRRCLRHGGRQDLAHLPEVFRIRYPLGGHSVHHGGRDHSEEAWTEGSWSLEVKSAKKWTDQCPCHPTPLRPSPALAPHDRDRWLCPGPCQATSEAKSRSRHSRS